MKRIITIVLIIIVILLAALFTVPVIFKPGVLDFAQKTLNKNLNAEVEIADLKLSLFHRFPQVSVELNSILIKGKGTFENDTLLRIDMLRTSTNLKSLFSPSNRHIEEIELIGARLNLLVSKEDENNWNLSNHQQDTRAKTEEKDTGSSLKMQLDKIEIRDAALFYKDEAADIKMLLEDVDLDIAGEMFGASSQLQVKGSADNFTLSNAGINYISNMGIITSTLLNVNFETMTFAIAENELLINRLPMQVNGMVSLPSDSVYFDLGIRTSSSDFDNFLALVPPVYEPYLEKAETSGSAGVKGSIKGYYFENSYPAVKLDAQIINGNFRYAELPEKIQNINAEIKVNKPQGDLDLATITISDAHAEIRNNPVDMLLSIRTPVSDPYFDGTFIGRINFSHLRNALPLDSVNISGIVDANVMMKGRYADIEAERYARIKTEGALLLDNFIYQSPKLTKEILIPQGRLDFSPQKIDVSRFQMRIGQSDFQLSGTLSGYLGYLFSRGTLNGDLRLDSQHANLNELLRLQVKQRLDEKYGNDDSENASEPENLVFDIPDRIDFILRSEISTSVINRIPLKNIKGTILARNEQLILDKLNMDMLEGSLTMSGSYKNTVENHPVFNFGFDIEKIDIPVMYRTLSGFRKMLPMSGTSTGKVSSDLEITGRLNPQLKVVPESVNGNGTFGTYNLQIKDSPVFNQLSGIVKKEKLRNVQVDDFLANFAVENGNLLLPPFSTKVIGQETTVTGALNVDNLIDMRLDFIVKREAFGPDIQKILAVIPGNEKIKELPAGVNISGPVGEPKVSPDLSKTSKAVADATKDDLKDSLDKLGKGILKLFEK